MTKDNKSVIRVYARANTVIFNNILFIQLVLKTVPMSGYLGLLIGQEYEREIEVSYYIIINEKIMTSSNYKRNKNIKRRPLNMLPGKNNFPIIWVDNKNSKIGFADKVNCQVFDKSEIMSISIQNVLPAKGSGGGYLNLQFKGRNDNYAVLSGACYVFNSYKEEISGLTGMEIVISPESYDC